MITKSELLMGRDKLYPKEYTAEIDKNIDRLLVIMNKIRTVYAKPMIVDSGWRPKVINDATSNSAKRSNHMLGLAVDIKDADSKLMQWVIANLNLMQQLGVYMEDFRWTPSWCHFQIISPGSGKRIYIPSVAPACAPSRWNGHYDAKYDKAA